MKVKNVEEAIRIINTFIQSGSLEIWEEEVFYWYFGRLITGQCKTLVKLKVEIKSDLKSVLNEDGHYNSEEDEREHDELALKHLFNVLFED